MYNVQQIIESIGRADSSIDINNLEPDTVLSEVGADSLDMMNIFIEIDDLTDILVPDNDMEYLTTAQLICDYVNKKYSQV
jgi:acyl carrier protein